MKNSFYLLLIAFMCSCTQKESEITVYLSDVPTCLSKGELYLSENTGLNVFYDVRVADSLFYCLDFHNDTILKVFSSTPNPKLVGYSMKGEGPNDLLFPFFARTVASINNEIELVELNTWSTKHINTNKNLSLSRITIDENRPLPILPAIRDYNPTDSCIYGIDVDMKHGLFFIYNKQNQQTSTIEYCHDLANVYPSKVIPYLLEDHLLVNEKEKSICVGMVNINCLYFFDLAGKLKKEIVIGQELEYPEADPQLLDFPNVNKYITSLTGTVDYLYCLYNWFSDSSGQSKIFQFNWEGELFSVIQTDMKLEKISADPNGNYILGVNTTKEGGTDLFKFNISK